MSIPSGNTGPATGDAIVARRGDRDRVPLQLAGIRRTHEINAAGEFSAFARLSDVLAIVSDPGDLRARWLMHDHADLGPWGGPISDVAIRDDGVCEVYARGWLSLLDKRAGRRRDRTVIAHAGAIVARIVRDAGASEPTFIADTDADQWGEFVTWRDDATDVLSALSRLSSLSDQDYAVGEADRVFYWRRRFGTDLTDSVQLVQGAHISNWRPSWALDPVVTEVVLSPSDQSRFTKPSAVSGFAADAYAKFGPRQQFGTVRGRLARSMVRDAAEKQAERLSRRGQLIDLDVVNFDGCWARFRKGDTIRVVIADIDAALAVRCLLVSWDQDANLVRISGEIQ